MLLLRITQIRWQRRTIYGVAIITTIFNLIVLIRVNILYCNPISYYWSPNIVYGTCLSDSTLHKVLYTQYSIATVADWVTSLLPIFILRDWKTDQRAKMVTYGLLGMGILASGASIACIVLNPVATNSGDYTYTAYKIYMAQLTEPWLGILAAWFATYRPLFRWIKTTTKRHTGTNKSASSARTT